MHKKNYVSFFLLFYFSFLFFSRSVLVSSPMHFPREDWLQSSPQEQGIDTASLQEAVKYLTANSGRDGVRELVIIRNGVLIHKGDNIDKVHGVWSMTKSFTSTVLGLLIDDGKATLDTQAVDIVPDMKDHFADVTLEHFTTMTSGYRAQDDEPKNGYTHGPSSTPFLTGDPLFAPGKKYAYWDSAMNQFGNILTQIAAEKIEDLFKRRIADPIGMNPTQWSWGEFTITNGIAINGGSGNSNKHIQISARQMARFGHLFLNRGFWDGLQLISADWIDQATQNHVPVSMPLGHFESGIDGRGVYGYNWWTNGICPDGERLWPEAPPGTFSASGYNNNKMFVIPEWQMVIVRLGMDQSDKTIDNKIWSRFLGMIGQSITGAPGPLCTHPSNPRYFTDGSGKAVYLTGSHTWNNLLDMGPTDPPPAFNFNQYLDWMQDYHHNFIRLWTWEPGTWNTKNNRRDAVHYVCPSPWLRTGPGNALDDKPKYDLTRFDPEYFGRLRQRVAEANRREIYVSIMLFEGWAMQFSPGAWQGHPFHKDNNINGINGDSNGDDRGLEIHTLADKKVLSLQQTYVRKVIDTLNDLNNVLYEISNENHPPSTAWQYHMIRFIKEVEISKPKQHPVGMTFQYKGGSNQTLFDSPADWISPNPEGGYRDNPPAAEGNKVILLDTDHLWGIGGNATWAWKSFLRGHNPLFMDPYDGLILGGRFEEQYEPLRRSLGATRYWADRMNLSRMQPRPNLSSTGYCLTCPAREYLIYRPEGNGPITAQIAPGYYTVEWYDPGKEQMIKKDQMETFSGQTAFASPIDGAIVLYLKQHE
ncbi:MAG: serine hydrolase [Sedimentisphaerales bacterium]|nr:serine hydrolase [Sedimentisphaerales bacterium]